MNRRSGRFLIAGALVAATAVIVPVGVAAAAPGVSAISAQTPTASNSGNGISNGNNGTGNGTNQQQQQQQAAQQAAQQADAAAAAQQQAAAAAAAQQQAVQPADQQAAVEQAAAEAAKQKAEAEAKKKAEAAAKALAAAQARAAKEAAQRAAAAQRGAITWSKRGKPQKLVIVRATSIDSVSGGSLVQRTVRNGRSVTLGALDAAIPSSWMAVNDDTARLSAAVVLTPGTLLDVEGVKTLQLAGGPDPNDAAFLYTGSGRIQLRNVTVTSLDSSSGQPVTADAAGRPYIKVSDQGRLDATNSVLSDLGTKPTGDDPGTPAISYGRGSTGTLNGVQFQRNSTGLTLAASQGVRLQDVSVTESAENGMILRGDRSTVLKGVKAERNGDNGVLVSGDPGSRPITGISTTGNKAYGVSISGQKDLEISDLNLAGDGAGGLELNRTIDSRVHDVTTTDEPNGVFLHVNSANMLLDAMTISGGRTGIVVEKTTKNLHVTGSTIDNAHVTGMAIGGHDTLLDGLTIKGSRTGVRVERGAGGVTANKLSLIGGDDGLVTSGGTSGIVVNDLASDGVDNALRNLSSGMQITGGTIRGGRTGMDLQAGTTVKGVQVGLTTTGVRARATEPIALDAMSVDAVSVGVESQPGSAVTLRDSSVHALEAVRGTVTLLGKTDLSLPPLNFLGAIGLPLIVLAIVLEAMHLLRSRRVGPTRRMPPPIPVGAG